MHELLSVHKYYVFYFVVVRKASKSFKAWWNERRKLKKREYRDVPSSVSYHSDPNVAVDGTYRTLTTIVNIHEFEDD